MRLSYSNMIGETGTNLTLAAYRYSTEGFYSLQDALYGRDSDTRGIDPTTRGRQRSQFQITLNQPLGRRGGALYVTGSVRDFYDRSGTSKQYQVGYNNAWRSVNYGFSALRTEEGVLGRSDTQYLLSMSVPLGRVPTRCRSAPIWACAIAVATTTAASASPGRPASTTTSATAWRCPIPARVAPRRSATPSTAAATPLNAYSHSRDFRQASVGANGSVVVHPGGFTFTRSGATPWCWWKRRVRAMRSSATPRACA